MMFLAKIKATLVGLATLTLFGFIYVNDLKNQDEVMVSQARAQLFATKADLQRHIDEVLLLTDALASVVHVQPDITQQHFDRITAFYKQSHPEVMSLQMAPKGIVTFVTDPERNRAAIGHNLLEGAKTRESARLAMETRSKIAVGPVELIQGGSAMIARHPIYLDSDEFWGFSTVLVNMDRFLNDHFDDTLRQTFAIRGVEEDGAPGEVFFGNPDVFANTVASTQLFFGNRNWQMAVSDQFIGHIPTNFILTPTYWIIAITIAFVAGWSAYQHWSRREELVKLVGEKTQSLQEALAELQRQNSKRNQIYGMIAHELRTPVSAISMMSSDSSNDDWLNSRETIAQLSHSLLDTLDDMRLLINPNLKREVRSETFTIFALSQQVERATGSLISSCGFDFTNRLSTSILLRPYIADLYRIRVAVTNLIRNACLHSEGDRVEAQWNLICDEERTEHLVIEVSDNGKGVPLEKQASIFELYQRGDTDAPGTGVGLHLAREWMREIGGSLELVPTSGGAKFQISVPIVAAENGTAKNNADRQDTAALLSSMRVLLVEDDPVLQLLGKKFFSMRARSVDIAGSWKEAIELFDTKVYEIIITDHFLPDKNGDQIIRDARAAGFRGIIIGHTAATLGSQMDELILAGADAVLPKPLSSEALFDCLEKITMARASAHEPASPGRIRLVK